MSSLVRTTKFYSEDNDDRIDDLVSRLNRETYKGQEKEGK